MIGSLVDLLEEKGVINGYKWEKRIEKRLGKMKKLKKFENLD